MNKRSIVVAAVCLSLAGCVPIEQQVLNLGQDIDLLMEKIDDQQSKLVTQIDKVQDHVTIVNDAVKAAKTLPEKAAAGIEASRPFNPYADEMVVGLGLLTTIGGLFFKKKIETVSAKYKAHKQGVERAMKNSNATPELDAILYDEIGKARAANGV